MWSSSRRRSSSSSSSSSGQLLWLSVNTFSALTLLVGRYEGRQPVKTRPGA